MDGVLVGVDGSEDSRAALRWATRLAAGAGVPVRVLGAWSYPASAGLPIGAAALPGGWRQDAAVEQDLGRLLREELGSAADEVTVQVARGPATAALLGASQSDTELLVVGTRGLGGFTGLLLGSVSQQLCEYADRPVAIVRGTMPAVASDVTTVVVATDGSADSAVALGLAAGLTRRLAAELVVANVVSPSEVEYEPDVTPVDLAARRELVESWCAPAREAGVAYRVAVGVGEVRPALLDLAHAEAADVLVIGTRGHGRVAKLLLGSVTSWLIRHGDLPVIVVPHQR
jgi:nucleotide-binding universal stress UspA family protein